MMDLRTPIGALFTVIGLLLAGYGLATQSDPGMSPTGIPIDIVWGLVLLAFGVVMLVLARRSRSK
ncbi:MAG TPA: hypothetical protein VGI83_07095 [Gemmatimonadales bacterium]